MDVDLAQSMYLILPRVKPSCGAGSASASTAPAFSAMVTIAGSHGAGAGTGGFDSSAAREPAVELMRTP
jgi:hypothetical protein